MKGKFNKFSSKKLSQFTGSLFFAAFHDEDFRKAFDNSQDENQPYFKFPELYSNDIAKQSYIATVYWGYLIHANRTSEHKRKFLA